MPTTSGVWRRALAVWLLIILAETVHGILRGLFLVPVLGDFRSRQVSVGSGILIIFAITYLCIRWIGASTRSTLLRIGAVWGVLTLCFEGLIGWATGASWERMLSDYRIDQGGLLGFGMCLLVLSPWLAYRLRSRP
ncbi:MAG: hypothetical protein JNL98_05730 [Bryobacterales bacterium]|nr:hypothetical protein [Bryobacterales bacterium]